MLKKISVGLCLILIGGAYFAFQNSQSVLHQHTQNSEQKNKNSALEKKVLGLTIATSKDSSNPTTKPTTHPQTKEVALQKLPTHQELKDHFERLDDGEINKLIENITKQIEGNQFITKANSGQLSAGEMVTFEKLMRKKESLYLIKADRIVSNMDQK